jgi:hypothetical protein
MNVLVPFEDELQLGLGRIGGLRQISTYTGYSIKPYHEIYPLYCKQYKVFNKTLP